MFLVNELFRQLPFLLVIGSGMTAVLFKSPFWWFCFCGKIVNTIVWVLVTTITKRYFPALAKRPQDMHCYFWENGKPTTSSGLPSGHCQSMGFFAMWMLLYAIQSGFTMVWAIFIGIIGLASSWFMMYTRVDVYSCHTWLQAMSGTLLGMIMTMPLWFIYKRFYT